MLRPLLFWKHSLLFQILAERALEGFKCPSKSLECYQRLPQYSCKMNLFLGVELVHCKVPKIFTKSFRKTYFFIQRMLICIGIVQCARRNNVFFMIIQFLCVYCFIQFSMIRMFLFHKGCKVYKWLFNSLTFVILTFKSCISKLMSSFSSHLVHLGMSF